MTFYVDPRWLCKKNLEWGLHVEGEVERRGRISEIVLTCKCVSRVLRQWVNILACRRRVRCW